VREQLQENKVSDVFFKKDVVGIEMKESYHEVQKCSKAPLDARFRWQKY
jgi:hypothetical protein